MDELERTATSTFHIAREIRLLAASLPVQFSSAERIVDANSLLVARSNAVESFAFPTGQ